MTDESPPRKTKLYGAIDLPDNYPPTIADDSFGTVIEGPSIGETIDRYRIDDVLGRGGMGEVLSARDQQIGRSVAIKRLRVENPPADVVARFLREARIQGRLEHPAVVPVHELVTAGPQPFFVMKQLAGTTLADVVAGLARRDARMVEEYTRQRLLRSFADVCLAIEFAHTRGVVHRDLKPANIIVGDFGEVYILDWGIARVLNDPEGDRVSFADVQALEGPETVVGSILGTPGYISPEQIQNADDLDGRADVYALGCILYEILTLQPLLPRGQAAVTIALAGVDARASVRAPDREIPPELDWICTRATQREPNERFPTARALGDALQRFLDGNRDHALRKELARTELAAARAALAFSTSTAQRGAALRGAARALALDPTDREAADFVGGLMLQPPAETPPEVERELAQLDRQALSASGRFGSFAAIAYLAFFPMLYWVGFREPWYLIAGPAVAGMLLFAGTVIARRNPYWSGYIAIVGNVAMFALFAWMVNPIVIGPGPAIIIVTVLAAHRDVVPTWLLVVLATLGSTAPWLLELFGYGRETTTVIGGDLVIHTSASQLDPTATIISLVIYLVALAGLAGLLSRLQDDERRSSRRKLQVQAWQLRQLVPRERMMEG